MIAVKTIQDINENYLVTYHNKNGAIVHKDNNQITNINVYCLKGETKLKIPVNIKIDPSEDMSYDIFIKYLAVYEAKNIFGSLINKVKTELQKKFQTKSIIIEPKSYGISLKFPRSVDQRVNFIESILSDAGLEFKRELSTAKKVCRFKIPKKIININILEDLGQEKITILIK